MTARFTTIVTDTAADYFAVCDRIKRGELRLRSITAGKTNGQWIFEFFPEPTPPKQPELFSCAGTRPDKQPQACEPQRQSAE